MIGALTSATFTCGISGTVTFIGGTAGTVNDVLDSDFTGSGDVTPLISFKAFNVPVYIISEVIDSVLFAELILVLTESNILVISMPPDWPSLLVPVMLDNIALAVSLADIMPTPDIRFFICSGVNTVSPLCSLATTSFISAENPVSPTVPVPRVSTGITCGVPVGLICIVGAAGALLDGVVGVTVTLGDVIFTLGVVTLTGLISPPGVTFGLLGRFVLELSTMLCIASTSCCIFASFSFTDSLFGPTGSVNAFLILSMTSAFFPN